MSSPIKQTPHSLFGRGSSQKTVKTSHRRRGGGARVSSFPVSTHSLCVYHATKPPRRYIFYQQRLSKYGQKVMKHKKHSRQYAVDRLGDGRALHRLTRRHEPLHPEPRACVWIGSDRIGPDSVRLVSNETGDRSSEVYRHRQTQNNK